MKWFSVLVFCAFLALGSAQQQEVRSSAKQQQPDPCQSKFRVVGDVTYCDRYWECVGGQPQLYDCPNGLAFVGRNRGIAEGCDYPWRGSYCDNKQLANPPISTEHCDWLYGIFGHATSCTRYWTCWNGTATEQYCIGGLLYSEELHACDWPSNVPGCQKHPLCAEDPEASVPLGQSCERYWHCQGGYPRLMRCPATLVFERNSRRCVAPPTEECDVPPPPPEDDLIARGERPLRGQVQEQGVQNFIQQEELPPPRRPSVRGRRPPLLFIPEGAQPLDADFQQDQPSSQFREPPIEGAIPLK